MHIAMRMQYIIHLRHHLGILVTMRLMLSRIHFCQITHNTAVWLVHYHSKHRSLLLITIMCTVNLNPHMTLHCTAGEFTHRTISLVQVRCLMLSIMITGIHLHLITLRHISRTKTLTSVLSSTNFCLKRLMKSGLPEKSCLSFFTTTKSLNFWIVALIEIARWTSCMPHAKRRLEKLSQPLYPLYRDGVLTSKFRDHWRGFDGVMVATAFCLNR